MKMVMAKSFDDIYIVSIKGWWGFLNHLHPFSNADITWDMYSLNYQNLQIFFLIVGLILPNIICAFLPEKELSWASEPSYTPPPPMTAAEVAEQEREDALRC